MRGGVVRRTMKLRGVTIGDSVLVRSRPVERYGHTASRERGLVRSEWQSANDATTSDTDSPYFHRPAHYPARSIATGPWISPPAPLFPKKPLRARNLTAVTPRTFIVRRTTPPRFS